VARTPFRLSWWGVIWFCSGLNRSVCPWRHIGRSPTWYGVHLWLPLSGLDRMF
jgi:hypothetical protein